MKHFALLAVGRDRPSIVAELTGVLAEHGCNIESSQMTILQGHFSVMLVATEGSTTDHGALNAALAEVGGGLENGKILLSEVDELSQTRAPTHDIAIRSIDKPGVMAAVTKALGERDVNITDLCSMRHPASPPVCLISLSVSLPPGDSRKTLEELLGEVELADQATIRESQ